MYYTQYGIESDALKTKEEGAFRYSLDIPYLFMILQNPLNQVICLGKGRLWIIKNPENINGRDVPHINCQT